MKRNLASTMDEEPETVNTLPMPEACQRQVQNQSVLSPWGWPLLHFYSCVFLAVGLEHFHLCLCPGIASYMFLSLLLLREEKTDNISCPWVPRLRLGCGFEELSFNSLCQGFSGSLLEARDDPESLQVMWAKLLALRLGFCLW